MQLPLLNDEIFGLLRPAVDAHTLGISYAAKLLSEAGYRVVISDRAITEAANHIHRPGNSSLVREWIKQHGITRLGLSYRLDPDQASEVFGRLLYQLRDHKIVGTGRGKLRGIYFAGLPAACTLIKSRHGDEIPVFQGDETPAETLAKFGVPRERIPASLVKQAAYDEHRMAFGRELVGKGEHLVEQPVDRYGYDGFGTRKDHLFSRVEHGKSHGLPPVIRVHAGPYHPERVQAVEEFIGWLRDLRRTGFLDVVSIGTSQLTQEKFGEDWKDDPNGGGVPVNSEAEYERIREEACPMLVRTYAGTQRIPELARIHERSLNIAWHALSFWWFSRIDGRGPHSVLENLREHLQTLDYIAETGKPFEPNIPHHFAFRGGDDVTYVLSAVLAARAAKLRGVRYFVLQNMLNTPKQTAGVQDLAKSRAMLRMVRDLEDGNFRVVLQPRAGLDYFSPDMNKAKAQLAAVSAMMDDIEPGKPSSPEVIHVVSYSEASHLATPDVIDESIQITRSAIGQWRRLRRRGELESVCDEKDVEERTRHLCGEVRTLLAAIEKTVDAPYSAEGLYRIFAAGFLATPHLWGCREEFAHATAWSTALVDGGVRVVDDQGHPIGAARRAEIAGAALRGMRIFVDEPDYNRLRG